MQPPNSNAAPNSSDFAQTSSVAPSGPAPKKSRILSLLRRFYHITLIDRLPRIALIVLAGVLLALSIVEFVRVARLKPLDLALLRAHSSWFTKPLQIHPQLELPALQNATINAVEIDAAPSGRIWIAGDNGLLAYADDRSGNWILLSYDTTNGCFHTAVKPCPPIPTSAPASSPATPPAKTNAAPNKSPVDSNPTGTKPASSGGEQKASQTAQRPLTNANPAAQLNAPAGSLSFTSPRDGSTVSGTIKLAVSVSGALKIANVRYVLDGKQILSEASPSLPDFAFSWDTQRTLNGQHHLDAVAIDANGKEVARASIDFTLNNNLSKAKSMAFAPAPIFPGARLRNARFTIPSESGKSSFARPSNSLRVAASPNEPFDEIPDKNPKKQQTPANPDPSRSGNPGNSNSPSQPSATSNWMTASVPSAVALTRQPDGKLGLIASDGRFFLNSDFDLWIPSNFAGAGGDLAISGTYQRFSNRKTIRFSTQQRNQPATLINAIPKISLRSGAVFQAPAGFPGVEIVQNGQQLQAKSLPGETVQSIAATPNENRLWFLATTKEGHNRIERSDDLGKTWLLQRIPTEGPLLHDFFFEDGGQLGFAVGEKGAIFATPNGGDDWFPATRSAFDANAAPSAASSSAKPSWWPLDWPYQWPWERAWHLPAPWAFISLVLALLFFLGALIPRPATGDEAAALRGFQEISAGDVPISSLKDDALDFVPIVRGLSGLLRNKNTQLPLTIAVNGGWGTGKTSLMNMLRTDLRAAGLRTVWFNAWHHQEEPNLLAALLQNVRSGAAPQLLEEGGLWYRFRLLYQRLKRWQWQFLLTACVVAGLGVGEHVLHHSHETMYYSAAVRVKCIVGQPESAAGPRDRSLLEQIADILLKLAGGTETAFNAVCSPGPRELQQTNKPDILLLLVLLIALWPKLSELLKSFGANPAELLTTHSSGKSTSDLEAQTKFRDTFRRQYEDVTLALLPHRLVIFIDDLDRCLPLKIAEVLEAVNYVVVAGPCAVVLGLENIAVEAGMGLSFKDVAVETIAYRDMNAAESGLAKGIVASVPTLPVADQPTTARRNFARLYMRKLLNVVIEVPKPTETQLGRLADPSRKSSSTPEEDRDQRLADYGRFLRFALVGIAALTLSILGGLAVWESVYYVFEQNRPASYAQQAPPKISPAETAQLSAGTAASAAATSGKAEATGAPATSKPKDLGPPPSTIAAESSIPGSWFSGRAGIAIVAAMFFLIAAFITRLLQSQSPVTSDTPDVHDALAIWKPVLTRVTGTPRELKRLLNRIRYLALLEHPEIRELPLWRKLLGEKPQSFAVSPQAIPDYVLVALTAREEAAKAVSQLPAVEQLRLDEALKVAWLRFVSRFTGMSSQLIEGHKDRFAALQAGIVTR